MAWRVIGSKNRVSSVTIRADLAALAEQGLVMRTYGGAGLSVAHGLTHLNLDEIETKSSLADACQRVVAVVDHTKLGQVGVATFVPISGVSLVITDSGADPAQVAALRAAGAQVHVA